MKSAGERPDEVWMLLLAAALAWFAYGNPLGISRGWTFVEKPEGSFRVVSWNVGGSSGEAGTSLRDEHVRAIADSLDRLEADIVVLQEVQRDRQLYRILRDLDSEAYDGFRAWSTGDGERRVAAIARVRDREDVQSLRGLGQRDLLRVRLRGRDHPDVVVMGVHADAWASRERNRELGHAADRLNEEAGRGYRILLGDFNLDLDLDKRRDLFTDDEYLDVETYNYLCEHLIDAAVGTGPTAEPDRRLDYVLIQPEGWKVLSAGPWKGQRVGDMDHDPLVVDLEFSSD